MKSDVNILGNGWRLVFRSKAKYDAQPLHPKKGLAKISAFKRGVRGLRQATNLALNTLDFEFATLRGKFSDQCGFFLQHRKMSFHESQPYNYRGYFASCKTELHTAKTQQGGW